MRYRIESDFSLKVLAGMLEETANAQLEPYGLGKQDMHERNQAWIIVRREIRFNRFPVIGEDIDIRTFAGAGRHGIYPRWYEIDDEEGNRLADVSCQWCIIDFEKRELLTPDYIEKTAPIVPKEQAGFRARPAVKFPRLTLERNFTVTEEYIDTNNHMNNAFYLAWAEEIAKDAGFKTENIKTLWIEYSKELMLGDEVKIAWERVENVLYLKGFHGEDGNFSIEISC